MQQEMSPWLILPLYLVGPEQVVATSRTDQFVLDVIDPCLGVQSGEDVDLSTTGKIDLNLLL